MKRIVAYAVAAFVAAIGALPAAAADVHEDYGYRERESSYREEQAYRPAPAVVEEEEVYERREPIYVRPRARVVYEEEAAAEICRVKHRRWGQRVVVCRDDEGW